MSYEFMVEILKAADNDLLFQDFQTWLAAEAHMSQPSRSADARRVCAYVGFSHQHIRLHCTSSPRSTPPISPITTVTKSARSSFKRTLPAARHSCSTPSRSSPPRRS